MHTVLSCPYCSEEIIKSVGADLKVRSKVLLFKGEDCFAVCKGCNHEVPAPIFSVNWQLAKSMQQPTKKPQQNVHLYLNPEYVKKS